jgi:hypothetical protein
MDQTLLVKVLAGGAGLLATMVLALTHQIDGPTAMHSVEVITGVFLGGAAVLGGAQALGKKQTIVAAVTTAPPLLPVPVPSSPAPGK